MYPSVKILLVDDMPFNIQLLCELLDHSDYELVTANSGRQALEILDQDSDFALVLMDVQMPDLDGFSAVAEMNKQKSLQDVPVIFVTADSVDSVSVSNGYALGAVDYLFKPYQPDHMLAKVAAFVEMYRTRQRLQREITSRIAEQEELRLSSELFSASREGLFIMDTATQILLVNPRLTEITHLDKHELMGQTLSGMLSGMRDEQLCDEILQCLEEKNGWEGEIRYRQKSGDFTAEWLKVSKIYDEAGQVMNYLGCFSDINTQESARQRLYHLANYDMLTDLPNRTLFTACLHRELVNARRRNSTLAILFLDLDRFKVINDTLGHLAGDMLLKEVAGRLQVCMRENDIVSRQGGDEFIALLTDLRHAEDAAIVAEKILQALRRPLMIEGSELFVTTSIGISLFQDDHTIGKEQLIKQADEAMYQAKETGRNNYCFYAGEMNNLSLQRLSLESKLRKAMANNELSLCYQPQFDSHHQTLIGMEALIRWTHPELGMISPVEFIPLAEETGLIIDIGGWVLHTACKQNRKWQSEGLKKMRISVNISGVQFKQNNFLEVVDQVLADTQLEAEQLELELTESVIMHDAEAVIALLHQLHDRNIKLSIDDFGTGYSSMSYLKRFPIQKLKIDRAFVKDVTIDPDDAVIVKAMINLSHSLHLEVIAEGVETQEQLAWLSKHDCDEIQGYYLGRPLTTEQFSTLLEEHSKEDSAFEK
ncbi:MAG: EAL domain-containing protein [Mariprofundaceae bacterium]